MLEDYVEHAHQLGMRDDRRTNNIASFEAKQKNQREHTQRGNNVDVTRVISQVHESKRRIKIEHANEAESPSKKRKLEQKIEKQAERQADFDTFESMTL